MRGGHCYLTGPQIMFLLFYTRGGSEQKQVMPLPMCYLETIILPQNYRSVFREQKDRSRSIIIISILADRLRVTVTGFTGRHILICLSIQNFHLDMDSVIQS